MQRASVVTKIIQLSRATFIQCRVLLQVKQHFGYIFSLAAVVTENQKILDVGGVGMAAKY